uniref:Secreted frizzled-related protein 1 n=1 Tax=Scleropages formosus TaxID=113540 RepID=A0A8C9RVY5_SCLFO
MKGFPRSCFLQLTQMALILKLVYMSRASEYDYLSWKSDGYHAGSIYVKPPRCVDIPDDLRLCHGVGYKEMLLPNLLEHETMAEVRQQAGSWVPLVHKNCHPNTQLFLCSLFAPVCLEQPIYPCRWLCEAVRDGCTPIMEAFGFPWPDMLTCDKFPEGDVCISRTSSNASEATKPTAIKTKIKEVKKENLDRKVVLQKKKKALKLGNLKKKDLKSLVLYLKNGADCPCQQLDHLGNTYLIMGRKVDKQYLLTGIHKWDKSSKEFRKAVKKLRSHKCPAFETVF